MAKIIAVLALSAILSGCVSYTERTSPCVCLFEPINATGGTTV